jgi:hypothetical protein
MVNIDLAWRWFCRALRVLDNAIIDGSGKERERAHIGFCGMPQGLCVMAWPDVDDVRMCIRPRAGGLDDLEFAMKFDRVTAARIRDVVAAKVRSRRASASANGKSKGRREFYVSVLSPKMSSLCYDCSIHSNRYRDSSTAGREGGRELHRVCGVYSHSIHCKLYEAPFLPCLALAPFSFLVSCVVCVMYGSCCGGVCVLCVCAVAGGRSEGGGFRRSKALQGGRGVGEACGWTACRA